eukprot:COSAG02_NODE_336_length_24344_cov_63.239101_16_plen_185_part_00
MSSDELRMYECRSKCTITGVLLPYLVQVDLRGMRPRLDLVSIQAYLGRYLQSYSNTRLSSSRMHTMLYARIKRRPVCERWTAIAARRVASAAVRPASVSPKYPPRECTCRHRLVPALYTVKYVHVRYNLDFRLSRLAAFAELVDAWQCCRIAMANAGHGAHRSHGGGGSAPLVCPTALEATVAD